MTQPSQASLTLPFLFDNESDKEKSPPLPPVRLAFSLDHRAWLSLLAEEWWPIKKEAVWVRLGVNQPVQASVLEDRIEVTAWVDPKLLPQDAKAMFWRRRKWVNAPFGTLKNADEQIVWPGPIPLFAVTSFSVASLKHKEHLLSLAQGFANLAVPSQDVLIEETAGLPCIEMQAEPKFPLQPPDNWNALRGAAAMAFWAVPRMTPWVDRLAQWLGHSKSEMLGCAPWLTSAPWVSAVSTAHGKSPDSLLWQAMLDIFMHCNIRESWNANELLESICDKARMLGVDPASLDSLLLETSAILEDKRTIDPELGLRDPLGLALQMVLLRPKPDQYVSWKTDLAATPPAVWWSGAILSGLIVGYRNLDVRFRGQSSATKLSALRAWEAAGAKAKARFPWHVAPNDPVTLIDSGHIKLIAGDELLLDRPLSDRGRWYLANYDDPSIHNEADALARRLYPESLTSHIAVSNGLIRYEGSGELILNTGSKIITVNGEVIFELENAKTVQRFNSDRFKRWLVSGSIPEKLGLPKEGGLVSGEAPTGVPRGLTVSEDFITLIEEQQLLEAVDNAYWLDDLRRRVQHYGWKYDYGSRSIKPSSFLGPLPDWADVLATRMVDQGLVTEKPDQVIVNEYLQNQGISKHVDCPTCFRGPIVTISLVETWSMVFRRRKEKYETLLPRRSAACLDGEARYEWTHEIAQRKTEGTQQRRRRISLTFRKVDI